MPSIKVNRPISNLKKSVVPKKNNTAEMCGSANTFHFSCINWKINSELTKVMIVIQQFSLS